MVFIYLHDAETGCRLTIHRDSRHRQLRLIFNVLIDDFAEIHVVQLIPAKNEKIVKPVIEKMPHMLPNRIGCALIPRRIRKRLLGRQHFHETAREMIKLI